MKVYFVGAGAGDVELLTLKAHKLLTNCTCCIWAGSLINPEIVKIVPESAAIYDSAGMNLEEIIETMQKYLERGEDVIRLHT
ncbi:MAG: SAM-dependent methyltransferase, partial [Planctomycetota bacterium]